MTDLLWCFSALGLKTLISILESKLVQMESLNQGFLSMTISCSFLLLHSQLLITAQLSLITTKRWNFIRQ